MASTPAPPSFTLTPRGPFSLAAAGGFLAGFPPVAGSWKGDRDDAVRDGDPTDRMARGRPAAGPAALHLAFPLDGSEGAAGVSLRDEGDGVIRGHVVGTEDVPAVSRQVARILSLDHDGSAYPAIGVGDPVVGRLQRAFPGLRPVCFASPYEAAAWGVLSHRIQMGQAARVKARLTAELGQAFTLGGETVAAFPPPSRLCQLQEFPGVPEVKTARLRAIALAALDGRLDADRLRRLPPEAAIADLKTLPGVGEWTAGLILLRGAGVADVLSMNEPRIRRAVAYAYGLPPPLADARFVTLAEAWRPYRTWVSFLMRVAMPADADAAPNESRRRARPLIGAVA